MMWTIVILALLVPAIITKRAIVNHMFDRAETDASPAAETEPEPQTR